MKNSAIRAFLTACVLLIILLFSGCGQLIEESEVRETLLAMFPGASVSDAVETKDEEGYTSRVYRVEVNGLSFTVENYQYRENLFGSTAASTRNDLAKSLYQLLRPDLTELAQRRGVTIEEPFGSNLIIKNPIEAYEDTERGLLAFEDALVLADPYLPKDFPLSWCWTHSARAPCRRTRRRRARPRSTTNAGCCTSISPIACAAAS